MKKLFKLSPTQWTVLSKAFSNISQAIILFSLAAFFVPEAVSLTINFSKIYAFLMLLCGLSLFIITVIISKKGK